MDWISIALFSYFILAIVNLADKFLLEKVLPSAKTYTFLVGVLGLIILIIATITWFTVVSITDGAISKRYGIAGGTYGERLVLDLTGRAQIYKIDLDIFSDYLLTGCGPGQANNLREIYGYGKVVAAHTEFSRMLAEHGILGLLLFFIRTPK